ncbi:MAG: type II toxin-antitoxin system VapC family toxin [Rhodocyclaceae bacterium]|nr:type II toxin-antitoxin system VapC family toxin [Rhodocyclaceae bacterium]
MKYLLDTNICIYLINHRPASVLARFRVCAAGDVGVSIVTALELAFGVEKSKSARNKLALEKFLAPLEVLALDDAVLWHYARLRTNLENQGKPIGALDMQIAAHALSLGCTLVTNNTREFDRVAGLTLENWTE